MNASVPNLRGSSILGSQATEKPTIGQISREADTHLELSKKLSEVVTHLEDRLSQLLREEPNTGDQGNPREVLVKFADYLRQANDNVAGSVARLESILSRLEI